MPANVPLNPPAEWFQKPESGIPTDRRITIEASGRAYGYIALFNQCHTGLGGCVRPPKGSPTNYDFAHQGETITASGDIVRTAVIAGGAGHAPVDMDTAMVPAYYNNTGEEFMRVRYGEDEHGLWFAGALWPDVDELKVAKLRASALSGDWRWHASWRESSGAYDLMGACLVNIPGYSTESHGTYTGRPFALAASAAEYTENVNYITFVEGEGFKLVNPRLSETETLQASGENQMACSGDPSNCGDCSGACNEAKTPEALIEEMRGLVAKHDDIVAAAAAQADPLNALVEKIDSLQSAVDGLVAQRLVDEITADFE